MASGVFIWDHTAANNGLADASAQWPEGMAPSQVNDSARAMMARIADYRDDISGMIVTGGTSSAYTVASYQAFDTLAHMNGAQIAFTPHATNAATVTLNVNSLGAKPLRLAPSVDLQSNTLIQGTPYVATYFNATSEWILQGLGANSYGVPLLAGMDFWGSTAPSSAFAFPLGQAISRTTYASTFALIGTTFGSGDGSTTFNLPDKSERVSVMKANTASRLTSGYFGGNSTVIGATGGGESKTLVTGNLPPYTPSGSVSSSISAKVTIRGVQQPLNFGGAGTTYIDNIGQTTDIPVVGTVSSSFSGTAQGGTSTPFATVQPTIVCNYIIRVI